jgi:hypothetical protein
MKRRTFVLLTVTGAVSMTVPFTGCGRGNAALIAALARPDVLSRICDVAAIGQIGAAYRAQTPSEARRDQLTELLLANLGLPMADKGKKQTVGIDETRLPKLLEEKIRDDYAGGRIVIIKGWVLSITEARQSALYSLGLQ